MADMADPFVSALSRLIAHRKRSLTEIGRVALGEHDNSKVRDFANYLSRITRGEVASVGLERIRLIARGMGYNNLATFFADLERSQDSMLQSSSATADNRPHEATPPGATPYAPTGYPVSGDIRAALEDIGLRIAQLGRYFTPTPAVQTESRSASSPHRKRRGRR